MAVESVRLVKERFSNKENKYNCMQEYQVKFDVPNAGSFAAMTASVEGGLSIPEYGSQHPQASAIVVSSIEAELVSDSQRHYKVTVEYTPFTTDDDDEETSTINPVDEPAEISYGATGGTEAYFMDHSSTPKRVTNSAGDTFESNPERDVSDLTITIAKNQASISPSTFTEMANTVNSGTVVIDGTTYSAGQLKLSAPTAVKTRGTYVNDSGETVSVTYYKVTYTFTARADGWNHEIVDVGYQYLAPDPNDNTKKKLMPINDASGKQVKKPWTLDGLGGKLGDPAVSATLGDGVQPILRTFKPYMSANHDILDLA